MREVGGQVRHLRTSTTGPSHLVVLPGMSESKRLSHLMKSTEALTSSFLLQSGVALTQFTLLGNGIMEAIIGINVKRRRLVRHGLVMLDQVLSPLGLSVKLSTTARSLSIAWDKKEWGNKEKLEGCRSV